MFCFKLLLVKLTLLIPYSINIALVKRKELVTRYSKVHFGLAKLLGEILIHTLFYKLLLQAFGELLDVLAHYVY